MHRLVQERAFVLTMTNLGGGFDVSAVLEQESDHVDLAKVACRVQWRVTGLHTRMRFINTNQLMNILALNFIHNII